MNIEDDRVAPVATPPLPRLARAFAGAIAYQDWSDAPWRADGAGHRRETDPHAHKVAALTAEETERIRLNVMWTVAQVLGWEGYLRDQDDLYAFAEACGTDIHRTSGRRSRHIVYGIRWHPSGRFCPPNHPDDWADEEDRDDEPGDCEDG